MYSGNFIATPFCFFYFEDNSLLSGSNSIRTLGAVQGIFKRAVQDIKY
jgi:hypothetical protein